MQTTSIQSTSPHFREGNSDKENHLAVEPKGEGYIVTYAYGRRGSNPRHFPPLGEVVWRANLSGFPYHFHSRPIALPERSGRLEFSSDLSRFGVL